MNTQQGLFPLLSLTQRATGIVAYAEKKCPINLLNNGTQTKQFSLLSLKNKAKRHFFQQQRIARRFKKCPTKAQGYEEMQKALFEAVAIIFA